MPKDHYVPQLHLKRFMDPDDEPNIWRYQKTKLAPKRKQSHNIGYKSNYYDILGEDGQSDRSLDDKFLTPLDNDAAPILDKMVKREALAEEERTILCLFLAAQCLRVPRFRNEMTRDLTDASLFPMQVVASSPQLFEQTVRWLESTSSFTPGNKSMEEFRQEVIEATRDASEWTIGDEMSLSAFSTVEAHAEILGRMNWILVEAWKGSSFVTSDNPVVLHDPINRTYWRYGLAHLLIETMEMSFPVCPELALLGTWPDYRIRWLTVDHERVMELNRRTVYWAYEDIYSSREDKEIGQLVQRYSPTRTGN